MKNLLALTILSLTGCGGLNFQVDYSNIDPEFIPYVQQFTLEAEGHGYPLNRVLFQKLSIQFDSSIQLPRLAECRMGTGRLEIHVAPDQWKYAEFASRELRLNHELGHCILGLQHNDSTKAMYNFNNDLDINPWMGPASLMNTYEMPAAIYKANREYFISQLFGSNINPSVVLYYNGPSQFDAHTYQSANH